MEHKEEEFHKHIDLGLWKKVFTYALQHKRHLVPLASAAIILAILEAVFGLITLSVIDAVVDQDSDASLSPQMWLYGGFVFVISACVLIFIQCAGAVSNHVNHDIKRDCFKRLQELDFAFFDTQPAGWLITRLTSDSNKLANIIAWGFLDLVWGSCMVVGLAAALLIINLKLGLIIVATIPPLIVLSIIFQRKILKTHRLTRKYNSQITASYNESIQGVKTTKTLGRQERNFDEFDGLSEDMFVASVRNAKISAAYMPIVMTIGSIGTGLVFWYGGLDLLLNNITIGEFIFILMCVGHFFHPINQMAMILTEVQGAQAAGERVIALLETVPKIKDSPEVLKNIEAASSREQTDQLAIDGLPRIIEEIEFHDVKFAYETGDTILEGFNLKIEKGKTIALVGPSGGGKSTIVNLVSRFYEPTDGEIRVNGLDYRKRSLQWLHSQLGIVQQTPHLFNESIRENIRYGKLEASDEAVENAAKIVNAHEFVSKLENGYDTKIGEGGARLSSGERQLISFARALLADPQIFIMDEATSSVDTETEKLIQEGLSKVLKGRFSFVIAHRLSTIRSADTILVIHKGKITESGTHTELIAARGHYYKLYVNQFRKEKEAETINASQTTTDQIAKTA